MTTYSQRLKVLRKRLTFLINIDLVVVLAYVPFAPFADRHLFVAAFFIAAIFTLLAFIIATACGYKCPYCGQRVTKGTTSEAKKVAIAIKTPGGLAACPHCHASFDQEMP